MSFELNIALLRQARKAHKLSFTEVASFVKISEDRLRSFERAEAKPTFSQLEKLANLYNIQTVAFYGKELAEVSPAPTDFRKPNLTSADLSPKGLVRIWQVQKQARFVSDLIDALGKSAPQRSSFKRLTNKAKPESESLRDHFDAWLQKVSVKAKLYGSVEDSFSAYLRLFIEVYGCSTVYNSAPSDDYLGFLTEGGNLSSIFVNRDQSYAKRKLFTLTHEMAHFLFNYEGVSNPFVATNDIEKKCNQYAAEFIAPEKEIKRLIDRLYSRSMDPKDIIDAVSRSTLLSRQAAALRLQGLEIISKRDVQNFFRMAASKKSFRELESKPTSAPMGRNAAVGKKLSEVGTFNAYVAASALSSKIVDSIDIERGLSISENLQSDVFKLAAKRFEAGVE